MDHVHGAEGQQTLGRAFQKYAQEYKAANQPSSTARMLDTLTVFVKFIGPESNPRELSRDQVRHFREQRMGTCSAASVKSDLARVRAFVNAMRAEGIIDHDPTFKVKPPAGADDTVDARGLTDDEERIVIGAVAGHPVYCDWVRLGICVGLRPGEQAHLRAVDYDHSRRALEVRPSEGFRLKTGPSRRTLVVSDDAHEILSRRKLAAGSPNALLFHTSRRHWRHGAELVHRPFDVNNLRNMILKRLPADSFFTLYALRHTFAYRAVEAGWEAGALMLYMGHSQISTTMRYFRGASLRKIGAPPVSAARPVAQATQ